MGINASRAARGTGYHLFMIALSVIMLYPLIWMFFGSFKEGSRVLLNAGRLLPERWTVAGYVNGMKGFGGIRFTHFFGNSFYYAVLSTIGALASSSFVAYGFARIDFRMKKLWFACMILSIILPYQVLMIPQYVLFRKLDWINTFKPLIVPHFLGVPFFIFLVVQFIRGIPIELDEAALIDGSSKYGIFPRIIVPLIKPALTTVIIFSFYWQWNDFLGPLIYLGRPKLYPVSVALKLFADPQSLTDWGSMFAMASLSLLPLFLIFFLFQRYIIEGISSTGIKG